MRIKRSPREGESLSRGVRAPAPIYEHLLYWLLSDHTDKLYTVSESEQRVRHTKHLVVTRGQKAPKRAQMGRCITIYT